MAPQAFLNPPETSTPRNNNDEGVWPFRTLRRLHNRWKSNQVHGFAPKVLFMTGFLINSTALAGLFFLLNFDFDRLVSNTTELCVPFVDPYTYSIDFAPPFFCLISLITFVTLCLMQCQREKLEKGAYNLISILGATTFLFSIFLILIACSGFLKGKTACAEAHGISELKQRFGFQAAASFITSLIYTVVGISLVKRQNQSTVNPVPPATPIYQIRPPEFDSIFTSPPPTYQQSQRMYQIR